MKRSLSMLTLVLAVAVAAPEADAQSPPADAREAAQETQEEPRPGIVAVRYFECPLGNVSDAVQMMNQEWRPIVDEMIGEGRFLDYGILTHAWGDEWNLVDYFVAEDVVSFHEAFNEAAQRMGVDDPEMVQRFGELCPRHKDNIYSVVHPEAPAEGGSR